MEKGLAHLLRPVITTGPSGLKARPISFKGLPPNKAGQIEFFPV